MATETELKLRITPDAAAALVRHPALKSLKRARSRAAHLTSTYYDTADGALAAAGVALRLRRDGRHWVQTIKGANISTAGGLSARPEFEWPVSGPRLDPLRFATTPFRRALGKAEQRGLAPRFTTDITRTTIPLTFPDSTMAKLCIDVGEVRTEDGDPVLRMPMHEIELELEAGDARRLYELAQTLASDVALSLEPATKAERGYALRQPREPEPVRADDADLPGKCSAGIAFASIMRSCLAQIEAMRKASSPRTIRNGSTRCASACAVCARVFRWRAAALPRSASSRFASSCAGSRKRWGRRATSTYSSRRQCPRSAMP